MAKNIKKTIDLTTFNRKVTKMKSIIEVDEIALEGKSLLFITTENPVRKKLAKLVTNSYFEMFIFANVIFSSILMLFDSPLEDTK